MRDIYFKEKKIDLKNENYDVFKIPKSFGDCVRFNGVTNTKLETVESRTNNFTFRVLTQLNKSISEFEDSRFLPHSQMEIYVTDNFVNSFLKIDPLRIEKNKEIYVSFYKACIETKLGYPFHNCTENLNKTNYHMNCIEECINKEIKDKYNCSIPSYYRIDGLEECGDKPQIYEVPNLWQTSDRYEKNINYIKNLTNEFFNLCENECPEECESTTFKTKSIAISSIGDTVLSFSFSDFTTLNITQIPKMNLFSLVSNIGGSLGLFIGISFLSFFELIEFFIDVIFIYASL